MSEHIRREETDSDMKRLREELARLQETEQDLRRREELYRTVFETAGTAIIVFDAATVILLANSNFQRLSGYSREELEGRMSWTVFIDEQDLERMKAYHAQRRIDPASVPSEYEFRFITRTGEKRDMLLNVALIPGTDQSVASCMDITARTRTEEALRRSEENYRNIIDTIQEAYYEVDLKGNFTFFNPMAWKALGYSEDQLRNMNFRDYMDEADAARVFDAYHRVFVTGEPISAMEFDAIRADGSRLSAEASVSLRTDASGTVLGFKGVVRDISGRKASEEALRRSEERYRLLAENSSDVIWTLSLDGIITYMSPTIKTLSGYNPEELVGRGPDIMLTPGSLAYIMNVLNSELAKSTEKQGQAGTFELKLLCRDGSEKDIEISTSWIKDEHGEPVGLQGSARDITLRKQAEEALRRSEERFRDLAELLPETVYEAGLDGTITFVNKSGLERFGYTEQDIGRGLNVQDVISPRELPRLRENLAKVFRGEKTGLSEYLFVRKDSGTFPGFSHSSPIVRNGRVEGVRGFVVDVTEKKNLEARLLHAQRMESVGTLAGGIAHDFNNLLMGILGNVSLAMMDAEEGSLLQERLKNMESYVRHASDLTRQLLGFARGGKYEVKKTDIGAFIRRSTDMFARTRREVRVHTLADPGVWSAEIDRPQMEQVMLNLYMNAWQAMSGGGDLYVGAENVVLSQAEAAGFGLNEGRYIRISVRDTGRGMDAETKARIFDPFFTTRERGRGTGLGLASVYGIVNNHGGYVGVESEPGVGTEFILYLPASDGRVESTESGHAAPERAVTCVLLVDDEDMILDVGSEMLSALGYRVVKARGGNEALERYSADKDSVDLVILDMIMPDLGGREVFSRLREMDPGVKVILSSGYTLDAQAKEIMARGCNGFIQKPFRLQDISRKIQEVLARG